MSNSFNGDKAKGQNIATQTTTLVKSGVSVLEKIIVNQALANGVIKIYDDVSAVAGSLKATITVPAAVLLNQFELNYDMVMDKGICIVTSGANNDITVTFR
jgi:hypothetical protein